MSRPARSRRRLVAAAVALVGALAAVVGAPPARADGGPVALPVVGADADAPAPAPAPRADAAPAPAAPGATEARKRLTLEDLTRRVQRKPAAAVAFFVGKYGLGLAGVVVAILALLRRRDERRGVAPPPLPSASIPAAFSPVTAVALVAAFFTGGSVVLGAGRAVGLFGGADRDLLDGLLATAAVTVPLGLLAAAAVGARRRALDLPAWPAPRVAGAACRSAAVGATVVLALAFVASQLVQHLTGEPPSPQDLVARAIDASTPTAHVAWLGFFGIVVAPLTEEAVFRGALYPALREAMGVRGAALASSAAFAAVHLDVTAALPLFGLAVLLAWQVERTGSLLGCAFVHAVNNATSLLPLFLLRE